MEDRKRDMYGDNFVDDYPPYWETTRFMRQERINPSAVIYGVGLALSITFVALVVGFLWAQAVDSVMLNYSFLVDLTLACSVLIGAFKGATRARTLGLAHGALVGLGFSVTGLLILALVATINWVGALETIIIAIFLGGLGGVVGMNIQPSRKVQTWRSDRQQNFQDDYDDFMNRL